MKLNIILSLIATMLCAIIAYGMYTWCKYIDMQLLVSIFGGICLLLPLGTALGIQFPDSRTLLNLRILSFICFFILLISNIVFCCLPHFTIAVYIISNGLLLILWLLGVYGVTKANS